MLEGRKHARVRRDFNLRWEIKEQGLSGTGKIYDVSLTGACFQIDQLFVPKGGLVFTLEVPDIPAFPNQAKLRWFRRPNQRLKTCLCGVTFVSESIDPSGSWSTWIDQQVAEQGATAAAGA